MNEIPSTAILGTNVNLGNNVSIGTFAVIGDNVTIGNNVSIGTFAVIGDNVTIGNNVSFKPFCEIRENCKIGNDVSFGSRCTLGSYTIIEDKVIIKYGFVTTNILKLGEPKITPCVIKKGSRFGINVTIMPNVTIGENAEIGACSQVRHNVPDNQVWYGNPAKFFKKR